MGFGGSVLAMVVTMRNNAKLLRQKTHWVAYKSPLQKREPVKMGGLDRKTTPEQLQRIARAEALRRRKHWIALAVSVFIITGSLLAVNRWSAGKTVQIPQSTFTESRVLEYNSECHVAYQNLSHRNYRLAALQFSRISTRYPGLYRAYYGEALTYTRWSEEVPGLFGQAFQRIEFLKAKFPEQGDSNDELANQLLSIHELSSWDEMASLAE